jgi:hypothetical protein
MLRERVSDSAVRLSTEKVLQQEMQNAFAKQSQRQTTKERNSQPTARTVLQTLQGLRREDHNHEVLSV